jgi:adenylylsulfate kinase
MTTGVVVWITGLPSAGKSTFARGLGRRLTERNVPLCVLDGDEIREALGGALAYTTEQRATFYEVLARLAALLADQGLVVLVPATSHRRSFRDRARELSPAFAEVWVDAPIEECMRRDAKGLYRAAASGRASDVPGADVPYEAPPAADVRARGGEDTEAILAVTELISTLRAGARRERGA